jgi:hypothetical protein
MPIPTAGKSAEKGAARRRQRNKHSKMTGGISAMVIYRNKTLFTGDEGSSGSLSAASCSASGDASSNRSLDADVFGRSRATSLCVCIKIGSTRRFQ